MTPAARYQAAIEVLDAVLAGQNPEPALRAWGRSARFAGSKDRAAISDHVYDVLRNRGRAAALAARDVDAATGRDLILGLLHLQGISPADVFGQMPYGPAALRADEPALPASVLPDIRYDTPAWLHDQLSADLGADLPTILSAMAQRAPSYLRVNIAKTDRAGAIMALAQAGIAAHPEPRCETALELGEGARKLTQSLPYQQGLVEVQDLSVQMAMAQIEWPKKGRILDYCAGAGGKSLAIAAQSAADITVHDKFPKRMADLAARAARAGMRYHSRTDQELDADGPFDLVLLDVPCSGSGTWRRDPMARWRTTPDFLNDLCALQAQIMDRAVALCAVEGRIIHMTCSLLSAENEAAVRAFLQRHPQFDLVQSCRFDPISASDGFFFAEFIRKSI